MIKFNLSLLFQSAAFINLFTNPIKIKEQTQDLSRG